MLGIASLVQSNILPFIVPAFLWTAFVTRRRGLRRAVPVLLALTLGVACHRNETAAAAAPAYAALPTQEWRMLPGESLNSLAALTIKEEVRESATT